MLPRLKPELTMTVGLPRSGKTTWAKDTCCPIVSPDAIRLALHGHPYISSAEPIVWAIAKLMVGALFEAGHTRVILDACNNTAKRRAEWLSRRWIRRFKVMTTAPDECARRAIADAREDLLPVIERMAEQHEPPTDEEFADDERSP